MLRNSNPEYSIHAIEPNIVFLHCLFALCLNSILKCTNGSFLVVVYRELDGSYLCFLASKSHLSVCQEKIYKLQWHLANGWNTVFCHVVYGLTRIHSRPICRFDVSSLLWMTNRLSRNVYVNVVRPNSIGTALLHTMYICVRYTLKAIS